MGRVALVALALCAGCGGDDPKQPAGPAGGTPSGEPVATGTGTGLGAGVATGTGTETSTGTPALAVSCAVQPANVLRWDCQTSLPASDTLEVRWTERATGQERIQQLDAASVHDFTVYALHATTTYDVEVSSGGGLVGATDLTTGSLPPGLQQVPVFTGSASFDQLLFEHPCASPTAYVAMEPDGRVVWYQEFPTEVGGGTWTADDTLLTLRLTEIVEHSVAGDELLHLLDGVSFTGPLHHDVFRAPSGLTYALFANVYDFSGTDYVLDGFYVFDQTGIRIATWEAADHITPVRDDIGGLFWSLRWPGAVDYSHANSIFVEADGSTWLSLRWLDSVIEVDGDPGSPTFGEIQRIVAGSAQTPLTGDYQILAPIGGPAGFEAQHDAIPEGGGVMTLFDNRNVGNARGLELVLDDAAGTATITQEWDVPANCAARGSTKRLPNGHVIVTCAPIQAVMEFEPDNPTAIWTMQLTCPGAKMIGEAQPISL